VWVVVTGGISDRLVPDGPFRNHVAVTESESVKCVRIHRRGEVVMICLVGCGGGQWRMKRILMMMLSNSPTRFRDASVRDLGRRAQWGEIVELVLDQTTGAHRTKPHGPGVSEGQTRFLRHHTDVRDSESQLDSIETWWCPKSSRMRVARGEVFPSCGVGIRE
jgi:hypothetical protein